MLAPKNNEEKSNEEGEEKLNKIKEALKVSDGDEAVNDISGSLKDVNHTPFLENTKTIYLYAIQAINDQKESSYWFWSFLSVIFLFFQLFTLFCIQLEQKNPTCPTHMDCMDGSYYALNQFDNKRRGLDYLKGYNSKWNRASFILFLFLSIAVYPGLISKIMCKAAIEEVLLDNVLKHHSKIKTVRYVSAQIVRVSLRARYFVLPWFTVGATVSVIVSQSPTIRNIVLNFFSIGVITQVDNMFASRFLTYDQHESMNKFIVDAKRNNKLGISWTSILFTKFIGVCACLVMSFMSRYMYWLTSQWVGTCYITVYVMNMSVTFLIFFHFMVTIIWNMKKYKIRETILRGVLNAIISSLTFSLMWSLIVSLNSITTSTC